MNILLSAGAGAGFAVAGIVFVVVCGVWIYCEFRLLRASRNHLNSDRIALDQARAILETLATRTKSGVAPEEILGRLEKLPQDSAVHKRVQTLATHRAKNSLSPIDRVALIETETARQQAGTDRARFWAGAFTFIGLIGTLIGLSIAVGHLILVIRKASDAASYTSSLSEITAAMTATFSGMGGAFLATTIGVVFSLLLSWSISQHEHAVEDFRLQFEEFSHLQLEPFVSRALIILQESENGLVIGGAWEEIDELAPMKALVARIEKASSTFDAIAVSFADSMKSAAASFNTLHGAADSTAASLQNSNLVFRESVHMLHGAVAPMNEQIKGLTNLVSAQQRSQDAFLQRAAASIDTLQSSNEAATTAFERLGQIEARLATQIAHEEEKTRETLRYLLNALHLLLEKQAASIDAGVTQLGANVAVLPTHIQANTTAIQGALAAGSNEQKKVAVELHTLVSHLRDYVSQIDEAIARHAAAAYAKPLAEFDARSLEASRQLAQSVQTLQSEFVGLRNALGTTGQAIGSISGELKAQNQNVGSLPAQIKALQEKVNHLDGLLQNMAASPDVSNSWLYSVDRLLKRL